jgi:hypothetical protein
MQYKTIITSFFKELQCASKFGVAGGEVLKYSLMEEGTKEQRFRREARGHILLGIG